MKHLYEILEEAGKLKSGKAKGAFLLENDCLALRDVLKGSYDDTITFFLLPKGSPPYEVNENPTSTLMDKTNVFKYFVDGGPGKEVPSIRRERMFIDLLESIHPKDAEIVIWMKDKDMAKKYNGLTKNLCVTTWKGLIVK
jgi:hypothetical protein